MDKTTDLSAPTVKASDLIFEHMDKHRDDPRLPSIRQIMRKFSVSDGCARVFVRNGVPGTINAELLVQFNRQLRLNVAALT